MKIILLFTCLLSALCVSAQTTRKTVDNDETSTREKYYVLKADKKIREGKYEQSGIFSGRLICEGFYKNNLKDSLWTYYKFDGKVAETGFYRGGKKSGPWRCYNPDGTLNLLYDYTNSQLVTYQPLKRDTGRYRVITGTDTLNTYLDRQPVYLDGDGRLSVQLIIGLRYPRAARESGIRGKLIIEFTINELGAIVNPRVKTPLGYGCDEEGLKAIKRIDGDWLPGMLNGKPVAVEYEIPVNFSLGN